jgi:hypothetical protein
MVRECRNDQRDHTGPDLAHRTVSNPGDYLWRATKRSKAKIMTGIIAIIT